MLEQLKVTTITLDGSISNIQFNESTMEESCINKLKSLNKEPDTLILKVLSNFIPDSPDETDQVIKEPSETKRGRKKNNKNDKNKIPRKKQGSGKYFNSQITFILKSPSIPNKTYNVKLFRTGSVGIPGGNDIKDVMDMLYYLIEKLKWVFDDEKIKLVNTKVIMINFKTMFDIPSDSYVNFNALKNILMVNHGEIFTERIIILKDKNNSLNLRPIYYTENNQKKTYLIELFMSGKINVKGLYPESVMMEHLRIIESYLKTSPVLEKKITKHSDIMKLINSCSHVKID